MLRRTSFVFAERRVGAGSRWCLAALVGLLGGALACRDPLRPTGSLTPLPPAGYEAALTVQSTARADVHTLRVRWRAGDAAPLLGAFQAELTLPPGLELAGDVTDQHAADGTLVRLLRADGARVFVTGAAGEGFQMGDLFVLTVRGSAERLQDIRLQLRDVVDQRGTDRLSAVRVARSVR
jgi:hypothetical protein